MYEAELEAWGERIGSEGPLPLFIVLRGDPGAGKSVLARAVARGAGVRAAMPSPTFNLVFRYEGDRAEVVHLDLFRLRDGGEVLDLGWRELGSGNEIVLVEWPERAEAQLPEPRWEIELRHVRDPNLREVTARGAGNPPPLPLPP